MRTSLHDLPPPGEAPTECSDALPTVHVQRLALVRLHHIQVENISPIAKGRKPIIFLAETLASGRLSPGGDRLPERKGRPFSPCDHHSQQDSAMRSFFFALSVLSVSLIASYSELGASDTTTIEDKAVAESARDEAIATFEKELDSKEALLRQVRRQRSPQLQAIIKQVQEAKKELATARRRPLEEYLADARPPKPQAEQPNEPIGRNGDPLPVTKGLTVMLPYTVAYVPQGGEVFDFTFVITRFNEETPTQGFFAVDGKAERLSVTSSVPAILKIDPAPKSIVCPFSTTFRKPGKVTVTVSAGRYEVEQEVEVVEIPIPARASSAEVIEALGLPTTKKVVFVDWPNIETIDCFFYSPSAGNVFMGEHWT